MGSRLDAGWSRSLGAGLETTHAGFCHFGCSLNETGDRSFFAPWIAA